LPDFFYIHEEKPMQRFISLLMIVIFTFFLPMHSVQAKRFGGGKSFGIQRNTSSFSNFSRQSIQNYQSPVRRSFASKWLGPLAGLVAGGLLATLFMQNGVGSGLLIWLGIGLAILFLVSLFRKKLQPETQSPYHQEFSQAPFDRNDRAYNEVPTNMGDHSKMAQPNQSFQSRPLGFDTDAFLRDAKVQFIRLQAAYDTKNLNDIREFTTPEIFGEIQMQLQERGDAKNETVVIQLEAELLDVSTGPSFMQHANEERYIATVRFTGKLREETEEVPLNETWHFSKDGNTRWLVAGVQQH
jgi:predicted lipid-binding transport protein (Tim44 family)